MLRADLEKEKRNIVKPTKRRTLRHTCLRECLQLHIKQHGTSMQHTPVDKSPSDAAPSPMQKPNLGLPRYRSLRNHTIYTIQAVDHVVLCNHVFDCRRARQFLWQETTTERDKDSNMLVAVLWNLRQTHRATIFLQDPFALWKCQLLVRDGARQYL